MYGEECNHSGYTLMYLSHLLECMARSATTQIKVKRQEMENLSAQPPSKENLDQYRVTEAALNELMLQDEILWKQRSKAHWLKEGDKNTRFFHQKASQRKKRNLINGLFDELGTWKEGDEAVVGIATNYFSDLFSSSNPTNMDEALKGIYRFVSDEMNQILLRPYTREEVRSALSQMHPHKAPGPDGMSPLFFQKYWHIVGNDISNLVLNILRGAPFPNRFNHTHIVLIPKVKNPLTMKDFRPISLCNVIYKIVSKVVANRLKCVLPSLISPSQSAFVRGRLITDNILVSFECFHHMKQKRKSKKGHMALKLDMSKAYDRIEWDFVKAVLVRMGFNNSFISLIMKCITTPSFSIMVNGTPFGLVLPGRGLRQGDPVSPYLFILCAEVFSGLISKAEKSGKIHGVQVARRAPQISHLFFADDSIIFMGANEHEGKEIKSIIECYERASGQLINFDKSAISFSRNVKQDSRQHLTRVLGVKSVVNHDCYLGLPTVVGRSRKEIFNLLSERVWKKIKGWKEKCLSMAAKEILLKSVVQAIPTYTMSVFKLPKAICHNIQQLMAQFWWNHDSETRRTHWISWEKLCVSKQKGGLGFRNIESFNQAMLAKQGWQLIHNDNSLVAQVLKAKYYPRTSLLEAKVHNRASFTWKSIFGALDLLKSGLRWRVGNGEKIKVFNDAWLPRDSSFRVNSEYAAIHGDMTVRELLAQDGQGWDLNRLSALFDEEVVSVIKSIPIPRIQLEDKQIWHWSKNGFFSVKTAYHLHSNRLHQFTASCSNPNNGITTLWNGLWSLKIPPKIKHFAWRMAKGSLPTSLSILKRTKLGDGCCPRCGEFGESTLHVFKDCPWVRGIWFGSSLGLDVSCCPVSSLNDWLLYIRDHLDAENLGLFWIISWSIWFARNVLVHDKVLLSWDQVITSASSMFIRYAAANASNDDQSEPESIAGWYPPSPGVVKVNVDAGKAHSGGWGIGAAVRDDKGELLAMRTYVFDNSGPVLLAELKAIFLGMELARHCGFNKIVVENDNLEAIGVIQSQEQCISEIGSISGDIRMLASSFAGVEFVHTKRSKNHLAHHIAAQAAQMGPRFWLSNFPSDVLLIASKDLPF